MVGALCELAFGELTLGQQVIWRIDFRQINMVLGKYNPNDPQSHLGKTYQSF